MISRKLLRVLLMVIIAVTSLAQAQERGQQLTFMRADGNIVVFDVESGTETVLATGVFPDYPRLPPFQVEWSPNGDFLTFTRDEVYYLFDVVTNTEVWSVDEDSFLSSSWSPDHQKLAIAVREGRQSYANEIVYVFDAPTGDLFRVAIAPDDMVGVSPGRLVWSPDSRWIVYRLQYGDLEIEQEWYHFYMVEASPTGRPHLIDERFPKAYQWMNDHQIVYAGEINGVFRFDTITETVEQLNLPDMWDPFFSPNTQYVARIIDTINPAVLTVYDIETGETVAETHSYQIQSVMFSPIRFSPDSRYVAYQYVTRFWGDGVEVLDLARDRDLGMCISGYPEWFWWSWSPDSMMIAYGSPQPPDGPALYIADIETGDPRLIADDVRLGHWSPDSQWLAYQIDSTAYLLNLLDDTTQQIDDVKITIGWRPQ